MATKVSKEGSHHQLPRATSLLLGGVAGACVVIVAYIGGDERRVLAWSDWCWSWIAMGALSVAIGIAEWRKRMMRQELCYGLIGAAMASIIIGQSILATYPRSYVRDGHRYHERNPLELWRPRTVIDIVPAPGPGATQGMFAFRALEDAYAEVHLTYKANAEYADLGGHNKVTIAVSVAREGGAIATGSRVAAVDPREGEGWFRLCGVDVNSGWYEMSWAIVGDLPSGIRITGVQVVSR